jgi:hypothetical protein
MTDNRLHGPLLKPTIDDQSSQDFGSKCPPFQSKSGFGPVLDERSDPFRPEHHWIGDTLAVRIKSHVTGDTGTLDFECHWMKVESLPSAHAFSSMSLARVNGHWLGKAIKVGKVDKLKSAWS